MDEHHKNHASYYALSTAEFKEQCLEMIAEITKRGSGVIIFDGDKPVAELARYLEWPNPAYGSLKGQVRIVGDIEGPMPVEWYTDTEVQKDEDWKIDGPMPASWFADPGEGEPPEYQKPEKVDVSILHRHKLLTLDTREFIAQLEEIIAAVFESTDGKVIVFDDEKPLVQITRYEETSGAGYEALAGEESGR